MALDNRIHHLDLNLLRVFETLFREQSITRAADVLNLTPSAVSHALKRLRDTLDDPLFIRRQNKMLPSPACQRMAPLIIDNLTRLQQILQQWGEFEPTTSEHHFRIGMHDAYEPTIVPQLTKHLRRAAPNVSFSSIQVHRAHLARELSAGHIDMAIDVAIAAQPAIKFHKLSENNFVVLLRKNHPMENSLTVKNYLAATHLNVSNRPTGVTAEDALFQKRGLNRKVTIRCQNYFAAREVLKQSDQLLTLSELLARQIMDSKLQVLPVPLKLPSFSTHLYWHENTAQDAALSWLRNLFINRINLMEY